MIVQGTGTPLFFFIPIDLDFTMRKIAATSMILNRFQFFELSVLLYRWKKESPLQMRGMELVPHLLTMLPHKVHMTKLKTYFSLYNFPGISRLKFMINPFTPRSDQFDDDEFLLTTSIPFQAGRWREVEKLSSRGMLFDWPTNSWS